MKWKLLAFFISRVLALIHKGPEKLSSLFFVQQNCVAFILFYFIYGRDVWADVALNDKIFFH